MNERKKNIFSDRKIVSRALKDSCIKLNPRTQMKNPVMFMVFVSAILTFIMFLFSLGNIRDTEPGYILAISVILWFTVLFGNFAEAIAEGRGKAQADAFIPVDGNDERELADAAQLSSLADETPEGRSIVVLAKERFGIRGRGMEELHAGFVPFTAKTRMSGIDYNGNEIRKGAADAIRSYVTQNGGAFGMECEDTVARIANQGETQIPSLILLRAAVYN